MRPLLSVIIPCFNSAYVEEAVASVLWQTFQNFELIIADCSTDASTLLYLESLDNPKVQVHHRTEQHLPGDNRNFAIEKARGEYIICLDADDVIESTFLEEALFVISCVPYDLVGTSMRCIGVLTKMCRLVAHPPIEEVVSGDAFVVTILMRKALWQRVGGFKDNALGAEHIPEDWDFFVRAVTSGATLYNRGSFGFHYRKHWDSLTAQSGMPTLEQMRQRIRDRHADAIARAESQPASEPPAVQKNAWRQLLDGRTPIATDLLVLPETINDVFIEKSRVAIESSKNKLTVLSTSSKELYPADYLAFLAERQADFFSLHQFLEQPELWLEFVNYLSQSRQVSNIWYGQNCFFLENLPAITGMFGDCKLHYLSRYAAPTQIAKKTRQSV